MISAWQHRNCRGSHCRHTIEYWIKLKYLPHSCAQQGHIIHSDMQGHHTHTVQHTDIVKLLCLKKEAVS